MAQDIALSYGFSVFAVESITSNCTHQPGFTDVSSSIRPSCRVDESHGLTLYGVQIPTRRNRKHMYPFIHEELTLDALLLSIGSITLSSETVGKTFWASGWA
jgi:hypothetical protein